MSIDPNLLIAAKIIYDECNKHNYCDECDKPICCNECQLYAICYNYAPHNWLIPDPPPEPTERPRIEWLRMLTPRELFRAQGFPDSYIIDRDADGKAYPRSAQVARCGNAVPPPFAEALTRANLPDLCVGAGSQVKQA